MANSETTEGALLLQEVESAANFMSRRGGGMVGLSNGQTMHVSGPNEIELLHDIRDLLREIRDRLKGNADAE